MSAYRKFFSTHTGGFTLIELSIVLIIIGLLAGGIMLGKNLIHSSELRSVITDVNNFENAVLNFRAKYRALPGDMINAESYWGTDPNGCPDATYNAVPKTATCNGDGNGGIVVGSVWRYSENFRAWQQLSNAGMIDGKYTGARGPAATDHAVIGLNVPQSRIAAAGYSLYHGGAAGSTLDSTNDLRYEGNYQHTILFGSVYNNSFTIGPAISPNDAWEIDTKMDDGAPATGIVVTYKSSTVYSPGCASSDTASSAVYAVTSYGTLCSVIFKMPF